MLISRCRSLPFLLCSIALILLVSRVQSKPRKGIPAAMDDAQRLINPWVLHFQKLSLELICPLCLKMLNQPMLLPCNHIFCKLCIQRSTQFESECLVCKHQYLDGDLRPAPFMENIVSIYRNLDATFSANLCHPDAGRVSVHMSSKSNGNDKLRKEHIETLQEGNSSNGQPTPNGCDNDVVHLNGKLDKCTTPENFQKQGFKMSHCSVPERVFSGKDKSKPVRSTGQVVAERHGILGPEEMGTIQVEQLSPPSFGNVKDRDDNSSDPSSSNQNLERYSTKRVGGNDANVKWDNVKRQKMLSNGLFETGVETHHQSKTSQNENLATSNCKLEAKFDEPLSVMQSSVIPNPSDANKNLCAFCHSFKQTDGSGPLLHYANGREVVGDVASFSKVIHVHEKCISWTPRVFFEGGTIKNLESEVARADKLKCSSCGKKGAALGCYVSSCRRTYHVPCAYDILDCRWDCDEFLLLCPKHASHKFPNEKLMARKLAGMENQKSKSGKQAVGKSFSTEANFCETMPSGGKGLVFCGSALSSEEKCFMVEFARTYGATVCKYWKPNVTHVIAATDANGACTRTFKVLMAILNGKWIVTTEWLKACAKMGELVNEEPYEVRLDNHGCSGGPKAGRIGAVNNAPKLFNCMNFYFIGEFVQEFKSNLLDLVITAGGSVIESKEQLLALSKDVEATPSTTLVVYNSDLSLHNMLGDEDSIKLERWAAAEELAREIRGQVIGHTWILESIAACSLQTMPSS